MPETENTNIDGSLSFATADEFQRRGVAEKAIHLITSDIDVSPMVIDGSWGAGKTHFCLKMIDLFRELHEGYLCVYVDAFKEDHADEPLMTLLAHVLKLLPESEAKQRLRDKALPVAKFALQTSGKALLSWALRQDADKIAEGYEDVIKDAGNKFLDGAVSALLQNYEEAEQSVASLRKALEDLAEDREIVIFVDELDRCRPDFAVNMLESIKHIFDVPGVHFVLVTNTEQLRASINHRYGASVDAQRYLDKFTAFSFILPPDYGPPFGERTLASVAHFRALVKSSSSLSENCLRHEFAEEFSANLIRQNGTSLREVETWVRYMGIFRIVTNERGLSSGFGTELLQILALYIYCFKPALRKEILNGKYDLEKLLGLLGIDQIIALDGNTYPDHHHVIGSFLVLACGNPPGRLHIKSEADVEGWKNYIKKYFKEELRFAERRNPIQEINRTLIAMMLGGVA